MNSYRDEDDPEYFPFEVIDYSRFDPLLTATLEPLSAETSVCQTFSYMIYI